MFEYAQVRHPGIAQHVPNAGNHHIRLVGQPGHAIAQPEPDGGAAEIAE
jgi:hypothetical protein